MTSTRAGEAALGWDWSAVCRRADIFPKKTVAKNPKAILRAKLWPTFSGSLNGLATSGIPDERGLLLSPSRRKSQSHSLVKECDLLLLPTEFGEIRDGRELAQQLGEQRETILPHRLVLGHHHYVHKELIHNFAQTRNLFERFLKAAGALVFADLPRSFAHGRVQFLFDALLKEVLVHVLQLFGGHAGLLQNLA